MSNEYTTPCSQSENLEISTPAISWIQAILQEQIHSDLRLKLNQVTNSWEIVLPNSEKKISARIIPSLYHLGPQEDLSCPKKQYPFEENKSSISQLYAPAMLDTVDRLLEKNGDGLHIHYDVCGLIYWMLCRCEEYSPSKNLLDSHSRFESTSSHAYKNNYLERPVVDEWITLLRDCFTYIWPRCKLATREFQIKISHDIDNVSKYREPTFRNFIRRIASDVIKQQAYKEIIKAPWGRFNQLKSTFTNDPFNTFDWLMDESEKRGTLSSFFFICGGSHTQYDARYDISSYGLRQILRKINHRRHLIGLHPSYDSYDDINQIKTEANTLQKVCREEKISQNEWGGRQHFLRWTWPTTAEAWEKTGFHYDSTMGYADQPGFRCGTCHEYPMFSPTEQRSLNIRQRPLIVMEASVLADRYLGLGYGEQAFSLVKNLKQQCRKHDGYFTLLWHNCQLTTENAKRCYLDWLDA